MSKTPGKTLRYIPAQMSGRVPDPNGVSFALQGVVSIDIFPPGTEHSMVTPIRGDLFAVKVTLSLGTVRWFGSERAFIDSNLRVAMLVDDRDEVLSKWDSAEPKPVRKPRRPISPRFTVLSGDVSGVPVTKYAMLSSTLAAVYEVNFWEDLDSSAVETYGKYNVQAGFVDLGWYSTGEGVQALRCCGLYFEGPTGALVSCQGDSIEGAYRTPAMVQCLWMYGCKDVACDVSGNNLAKLVAEARGSL